MFSDIFAFQCIIEKSVHTGLDFDLALRLLLLFSKHGMLNLFLKRKVSKAFNFSWLIDFSVLLQTEISWRARLSCLLRDRGH